jgi:hypothetical protein
MIFPAIAHSSRMKGALAGVLLIAGSSRSAMFSNAYRGALFYRGAWLMFHPAPAPRLPHIDEANLAMHSYAR